MPSVSLSFSAIEASCYSKYVSKTSEATHDCWVPELAKDFKLLYCLLFSSPWAFFPARVVQLVNQQSPLKLLWSKITLRSNNAIFHLALLFSSSQILWKDCWREVDDGLMVSLYRMVAQQHASKLHVKYSERFEKKSPETVLRAVAQPFSFIDLSTSLSFSPPFVVVHHKHMYPLLYQRQSEEGRTPLSARMLVPRTLVSPHTAATNHNSWHPNLFLYSTLKSFYHTSIHHFPQSTKLGTGVLSALMEFTIFTLRNPEFAYSLGRVLWSRRKPSTRKIRLQKHHPSILFTVMDSIY